MNNYNNIDFCYGKENFMNLITLSDFKNSTSNPFSLIYYYSNLSKPDAKITFDQNKTFEENLYVVNHFSLIFFAACYGYSLFRIIIDISVIVYTYKRIDFIRDPINKCKNNPDRITQLNWSEFILWALVLNELLMSLHNFIVWRGVQYYTSYQDGYLEEWVKIKREKNCIYDFSLYGLYLEGPKSKYLTIMYNIWCFLMFASMLCLYFAVFCLARINRKTKTGERFYLNNFFNAFKYSLCFCVIIYLFIFEFEDTPIFYRFYNKKTLAFWFFWKVIGGFILIEKMHSKASLTKKLKIKMHHIHKSDEHKNIWENIKKKKENLNITEQMALLLKSDYINLDLLKEKSTFIKDQYQKWIKIFFQNVQEYLKKKKEKHKSKKLKTHWANYLNYLLLLNFMGIIGYFFLLLDVLIHYEKDRIYLNRNPIKEGNCILYLFGLFFCYFEIILFDLTNGIFLLNSFFIQIYKHIKKDINNINESDTESSLMIKENERNDQFEEEKKN